MTNVSKTQCIICGKISYEFDPVRYQEHQAFLKSLILLVPNMVKPVKLFTEIDLKA
ncbi:hypothetical protein SAMN05216167_104511 [Spirosoma endophyticum]|uniref:Uncharacterized protein n=1 Tax=Spirosoma endophyticum TaxID=662367 RepID=A0A1I1RR81_9BACT|nr:hypothetical protein SAMN05216167_104511 [Spirosoma endophyticum]